jgi:ankyrin repeat protein
MIVRFVENMKCNFDSCFQVAVTFHHNPLVLHLARTHDGLVDDCDRFGKMVTTSSAAADNITALLFCLNRRLSVDTAEGFGWTPLHCAAERGALDTCFLLINIQDLDPNPRDAWGLTPLHLAADSMWEEYERVRAEKCSVM